MQKNSQTEIKKQVKTKRKKRTNKIVGSGKQEIKLGEEIERENGDLEYKPE